MILFNYFRILFVFLLLNAGLCLAQPNYSSPIRLQLAWSHQSQFAGVYVAQVRKHFRNEGIDLIVVPGGSGINPITELQVGNADVAISWFNNAYELSTPDKPITNIAQIFSGSALNIACRISAGVYSPADIRGKKIGIWGVGDQKIVYEWLDQLKIPHAIAFGPDGETIWFTGKNTSTIGVISPNGQVKHLPLKTTASTPIYIALGPDGNMWGTELVGNHIFQARSDGTVSEYTIPTKNSRPIAIVRGPDGDSMWFSEEAGRKLARINMKGEIVEYPIPSAGGDHALLAGLAFDRAGNLWTQMYTANSTHNGEVDYIVKIDKSIANAPEDDISGLPISYYRTPSQGTMMHRIVLGSDGNMWFTEMHGGRIGRINTGIPLKGN